MICMIGLNQIDQMIGDREIDCLGCYKHGYHIVDLCLSYDILHNKMGLFFSK